MPERGPQNAKSQITELKVSGHMMALDPGLYCVFNAPDGPSPAADSGLPGVRITAAPGRREGQVSVSGFHADGWIGSDSAALVRVIGSAAEILVTVYQAPDSTGEAPKLQVVRLSGGGAASPGAAPDSTAAAPATPPAQVETVAHIYARGDVGGRLGDWMGEPGSNRWIEGFGIAPAEGVPASDIEYQAVLGRGWLSPWSEGGQFCGSRGMSLPILGLRIRLRGDSAATHRVSLSASFVDGTRIGPVTDGEPCEAPSLAALEAFQVLLEPKTARASAKPARAKAASSAAAASSATATTAPTPKAVPRPAPAKKASKAAARPQPEPPPAKPPARAAAKPKPATTRRR